MSFLLWKVAWGPSGSRLPGTVLRGEIALSLLRQVAGCLLLITVVARWYRGTARFSLIQGDSRWPPPGEKRLPVERNQQRSRRGAPPPGRRQQREPRSPPVRNVLQIPRS